MCRRGVTQHERVRIVQNMTTPTGSNSQPLLISYQEAAHLLGVSDRTVWTMCHVRGELPFVRFGNLCRIPRAAIDEFIASQSCV